MDEGFGIGREKFLSAGKSRNVARSRRQRGLGGNLRACAQPRIARAERCGSDQPYLDVAGFAADAERDFAVGFTMDGKIDAGIPEPEIGDGDLL